MPWVSVDDRNGVPRNSMGVPLGTGLWPELQCSDPSLECGDGRDEVGVSRPDVEVESPEVIVGSERPELVDQALRDGQFVGDVGQLRKLHHILLALHGLVTRYVAGPLLASVRWLQRRAGARQPAVPRGGLSVRWGRLEGR